MNIHRFGSTRAEVDAWESREIERAFQRAAWKQERLDNDRHHAEEAARAGKICCGFCSGWTRYAEEVCDQCGRDPAEGPDRLYRLSVEALERIAREGASGEAA